MKIKDAIETLKLFDPTAELIVRANQGDGYYSNHEPIFLNGFFPDESEVHIIQGPNIEDANEHKSNEKKII